MDIGNVHFFVHGQSSRTTLVVAKRWERKFWFNMQDTYLNQTLKRKNPDKVLSHICRWERALLFKLFIVFRSPTRSRAPICFITRKCVLQWAREANWWRSMWVQCNPLIKPMLFYSYILSGSKCMELKVLLVRPTLLVGSVNTKHVQWILLTAGRTVLLPSCLLMLYA